MLSAGHLPGQGAAVIQRPEDITFDLLATTARVRTYEMDRVRRFLDQNGDLVGVRERLLHHHDGTREAFRLDFLAVETAPGGAGATATWQSTYARQSGLLQKHGGFAVHDPAAARQNYQIYWLGSTTRLGRLVERVVVFPRALDRSIWLLDLDRVSGLPLYSGEFDPTARLVSELEVVRLALGPAVRLPESTWAWEPWMVVQDYATVAAARTAMGSAGAAMLEPESQRLPAGYELQQVQTVENPLNGNRSLVLSYGDGIDELFVLQSHDQLEVFSGLPVAPQGSGSGHRVAYFQDSSLGAYLFQEGVVRFMVVGRGALTGLRPAVEGIYRQALGL